MRALICRTYITDWAPPENLGKASVHRRLSIETSTAVGCPQMAARGRQLPESTASPSGGGRVVFPEKNKTLLWASRTPPPPPPYPPTRHPRPRWLGKGPGTARQPRGGRGGHLSSRRLLLLQSNPLSFAMSFGKKETRPNLPHAPPASLTTHHPLRCTWTARRHPADSSPSGASPGSTPAWTGPAAASRTTRRTTSAPAPRIGGQMQRRPPESPAWCVPTPLRPQRRPWPPAQPVHCQASPADKGRGHLKTSLAGLLPSVDGSPVLCCRALQRSSSSNQSDDDSNRPDAHNNDQHHHHRHNPSPPPTSQQQQRKQHPHHHHHHHHHQLQLQHQQQQTTATTRSFHRHRHRVVILILILILIKVPPVAMCAD